MIPVDQTSLHRPGEPPGNCFAACLASLLHVPLDSVPQPREGEGPESDWASYWERIAVFLAGRGFYLLLAPAAGVELESTAPLAGAEEALAIAGGPTWRGNVHHVVVIRGREIVHDPHPSREGLVEAQKLMYLVPLDPSRLVPPGLVVSQYTLREARPGFWTEVTLDRMVQRDGRVLWKVSLLGSCLNRDGEWEHEPSPSYRDDAFFTRCRFSSIEEALEHWGRARPLLVAELRQLSRERGVPLPEGLEP
jgi:hypothetical protein